jgi:RNA polymerase primary sigma factor
MEPDEIRDLIDGVPQTIALETTIGDDSELGDLIEDEDSPSPDEAMDGIMLTDVIEDILGELVPREADILRLRFGLDDGTPKTLEQVGEALGLSRERIRQIEASVLRKLREPYYRRKLQDFVAA